MGKWAEIRKITTGFPVVAGGMVSNAIGVAGVWSDTAKSLIPDPISPAYIMIGAYIFSAIGIAWIALLIFSIFMSLREERLAKSPPDMPLSHVIRYLGHGSHWSVSSPIVAWSEWPKEAEKEIRKYLKTGDLIAWGTWHPSEGQAGKNERVIKPEEWETLEINPYPMAAYTPNMNHARNGNDGTYHGLVVGRYSVKSLWKPWTTWDVACDVFSIYGKKSFAEKTGESEYWREQALAYNRSKHDPYFYRLNQRSIDTLLDSVFRIPRWMKKFIRRDINLE